MGTNGWGDNSQISAKEYEALHGEKRTGKRVVTPAGVAYAVKNTRTGFYSIWRMDQLLGTVMKHTRPTCWVASSPDGKHLTTDSNMKWCVEQMQMAIPVSSTITDTATKQYAEQLVKKHGAEEAMVMTCGPARDAVVRFLKEGT